jgi:hypothetical protein
VTSVVCTSCNLGWDIDDFGAIGFDWDLLECSSCAAGEPTPWEEESECSRKCEASRQQREEN